MNLWDNVASNCWTSADVRFFVFRGGGVQNGSDENKRMVESGGKTNEPGPGTAHGYRRAAARRDRRENPSDPLPRMNP